MKNGSAQPFIRWAALLAGLLLSAAAHASLVGPVTVKLIAPGGTSSDPTPFELTQLTDVLYGVGDIGSMMLDDEYIKVVGNSLHIRLNAGSEAGGIFTTGYLGSGGEHARYVFSGLGVAGSTIVGLNVSALDFDGVGTGFSDPSSLGIASYVDLLTPSSISFELDELQFIGGHQLAPGGYNYMDVTIDLVLRDDGGPTQPLPEPGSLALVLLGMGLARRACRSDSRHVH